MYDILSVGRHRDESDDDARGSNSNGLVPAESIVHQLSFCRWQTVEPSRGGVTAT